MVTVTVDTGQGYGRNPKFYRGLSRNPIAYTAVGMLVSGMSVGRWLSQAVCLSVLGPKSFSVLILVGVSVHTALALALAHCLILV